VGIYGGGAMGRGRTCFGDDGDLFFAVGEKEELESVGGGFG